MDAAVRAQGEADEAWADARRVRKRAESEAEAAVKRVLDADRAAAGVLEQTAAAAPAGGGAGIPQAELPAPPPRKGNVFGAFFGGLFAGDFDQEGYDSTGLELSRAVGQTLSGLVAVGDVRDVAGNVSHGNWGGAGLSAFGIVPLFGDGAKIVKSGDNVVDATAAARRAEIMKRVSDNASRYMKSMDESVGGHSFVRHGADTTLDEQRRYAKEGVTPDGVKKKYPSNASRFLSHQDQLQAMQRAMTIRRQLGWDEVAVDMGRVVGEGYKVGGEEYVRTGRVIARFRPGEDYPYTAFPDLGGGGG